MANIILTPEDLRTCAKTIDDNLKLYEDEVKAIDEKIKAIKEGWEGAAKDEFIKKYDEVTYPFLTETVADALTGIAQQLRAICKAIESTDSELEGTFQ